MMRVLITVDTEAWPPKGPPPREHIAAAVARDIFGVTAAGEFGIRRQMDILDRHGLKAVFHVEALFATAVGLEPLAQVVRTIDERGHDVQLHLHTEWLGRMAAPLVPIPPLSPGEKAAAGQHLRFFDGAAQERLLAEGLANLRAAGARSVVAFRAGNFAADNASLGALARLGLLFDTSYNAPYLGRACDIRVPGLLLQPAMLEGVCELPVTCYRAGRRLRHAQVNGCSTAELRALLAAAAARGDRTFVIVFHGFELLNTKKDGPDPIVLRRFESLCAHLAECRDVYRVVTFAELAREAASSPAPTLEARVGSAGLLGPAPDAPLVAPFAGRMIRLAEQVLRRLR